MDGDRFDSLTRALRDACTRRGVLTTLLAGTFGLLGLADAGAKKGGGKNKNKKKGKGKKGSNNDNRTAPPPPGITCSDGVKNGSESDVDCGGGACARCATGKSCGSRTDCASALCSGGACQACAVAADCGNDVDGSMCACRENAANQRVCTKISGRPFIAGGTCANCQAGEQCILPPGGVECLPPCGT